MRWARRPSWSLTTSRRRSSSWTTCITCRTAASSRTAHRIRCAMRVSRWCDSSCMASRMVRSRSNTRLASSRRISSSVTDDCPIRMINVRGIGHHAVDSVWRLGYASRFFALTIASSGASFRRLRLLIRELYFTGVLSLIIILVSGLFVGMVLGLQGYHTLQTYGSESALGVLVALSLVRELGPVVSALLFASRAGSAMTAEIGLMKATEQLAAMEIMAVDPIARVVAPRFWAGVISMPLLAAMFSAMGVYGGYLIGVVVIGVDEGSFWSQMQSAVDFREDIVNGVIKSVVFGIAVTWIALFEGYDAPPTAEGVSGATTRTVVTSSLAILGLDFILTAFMFRGA